MPKRAYITIHADEATLGFCNKNVRTRMINEIAKTKTEPDAHHYDIYHERVATMPSADRSSWPKSTGSEILDMERMIARVSGTAKPRGINANPGEAELDELRPKLPAKLQNYLKTDSKHKVIIEALNHELPRPGVAKVIQKLLPELEGFDEIVLQGAHFYENDEKANEGCVNEALKALEELRKKGVKITVNKNATDCES